MKNISLILNAVLLVAVGILYYLHFANTTPGNAESSDSVSLGDLKIAYFNSDSVLKHYEYLDANRKQIEQKTKKMEQEYRNRVEGLQNEIANYQRNVNNLTLSQVRAVEEDLGKKQQNLKLYEQSLSQELMNEEAKLNKALYDRVTEFLEKYGKENGLHIVVKFDPTSDVMYANNALDISDAVIKGLNEDYKSEQTDATGVSDSTKQKK